MEKKENLPYIVFPDDYKGFSPEYFCIPKHYEGALECVLVPGGLVKDRVECIAKTIAEDMGSEPLYALCVLKGGYKFFTDLIDQVKMYNHYAAKNSIRISVDFIRLKSYEDDKSSGKLKVLGVEDLGFFKGKNVLIVEDVIDTGRTMKELLQILKNHGAKSVKVASCLVKRTHSSYRPDYCGFEVADKFVVGYAIDYNEYFRDIDHICVVNEYGKKKFGSSYGNKESEELLGKSQ